MKRDRDVTLIHEPYKPSSIGAEWLFTSSNNELCDNCVLQRHKPIRTVNLRIDNHRLWAHLPFPCRFPGTTISDTLGEEEYLLRLSLEHEFLLAQSPSITCVMR